MFVREKMAKAVPMKRARLMHLNNYKERKEEYKERKEEYADFRQGRIRK